MLSLQILKKKQLENNIKVLIYIIYHQNGSTY